MNKIAARNHEQTLETLLKHGCAVDIPDKDGLTALAYCIRNENIRSIKLLVKCGCRIDLEKINSTECLRAQLDKYPQIQELLFQEKTRVKSLKEFARLKIRKCLDQRLISKCSLLPLPQVLKDYVSMKEIFTITNNKLNTPCSSSSAPSSPTSSNSNNNFNYNSSQSNNYQKQNFSNLNFDLNNTILPNSTSSSSTSSSSFH